MEQGARALLLISSFIYTWQYAWADESDKLRPDYQEGIETLKLFLDATNEKMTAPVQVSFNSEPSLF
ncbi:hypothetical protein NHX12_028843 [Muraenolepis orangiensis]|uniref:Uncharacterized protein n=1 Tax=Muraenolepis orangiensis TaxID=630683 RepID=A0A9Q0EA52_9TELE|nr:hypothetical protein NHX12_028843 [Muraenolepis orangiensis]